MKKVFMMAAVATLMANCNGSKISLGEAMTHEWEIKTINGKALEGKSETVPFIGIDVEKSQIYGSAGCNRLTGALTIDGDASKGSIDLSKMGMTRMMCADMATETKVTEALNRVKGYKLNKNILVLTDAKGDEVMKLQSR